MALKIALVLCLVLVPCALAGTKRFKRQFPGFSMPKMPSMPNMPSMPSKQDMAKMFEDVNQLSKQAEEIAKQALSNSQLSPEQQHALAAGSQDLLNRLNDNLQTATNDPADQGLSQLLSAMSNLTPQQMQKLESLGENENFKKEYKDLQNRYQSNMNSDAYEEEMKGLVNRYLNGGEGVVVSLVAMVASLVLQALLFG